MKYDYEMVFNQRCDNIKADSLSRVPVKETEECVTEDDQDIICQLWEPMKIRITLAQLQEHST